MSIWLLLTVECKGGPRIVVAAGGTVISTVLLSLVAHAVTRYLGF